MEQVTAKKMNPALAGLINAFYFSFVGIFLIYASFSSGQTGKLEKYILSLPGVSKDFFGMIIAFIYLFSIGFGGGLYFALRINVYIDRGNIKEAITIKRAVIFYNSLVLILFVIYFLMFLTNNI